MPKIAHIADVHWRGLSRHQEYRDSFEKCFEILRELKPDRIFLGGDIVHSKTQGISPELISCLTWWFRSMADIAHVDIILGNHDGILFNRDREDTISPIIDALNDPRISLYKRSGMYPIIPGFNWCVFSCFDEKGWETVKPLEGDVNIALFHGSVRGSLTDADWALSGEVDTSFFNGFDFAFLGDIHRMQFLTHDRRLAYCGSTIQQDYGEEPGKGFLLWDIRSKDDFNVTFHEVPHKHPFVTVDWKGSVGDTLKAAQAFPKNSRFRIRTTSPIPQVEINQLSTEIKIHRKAAEVVFKDDHEINSSSITTGAITIGKSDLTNSNVLKALLRDYMKDVTIADKERDALDDMVDKYLRLALKDGTVTKPTKWSLKRLNFDNTFVYGKSNKINFQNLPGITGIFGRNRRGKSSVIGTIVYTLFNSSDRGSLKNYHVVNTRKDYCSASADIVIDDVDYRVERQTVKTFNKHDPSSSVTHLNLFKIDEKGEIVKDESEEQRKDTERTLRSLLGVADDFLLTTLAAQGEMNTFIKMGPTSRKSTLFKFLGFDVFAQMYKAAKDDSLVLSGQIKSDPGRDWDSLIQTAIKDRKSIRKLLDNLDMSAAAKSAELQGKQVRLASFENVDVITRSDVERQKKLIDKLVNQQKTNTQKQTSLGVEQKIMRDEMSGIEKFLDSVSIEDLRDKVVRSRDLDKLLVNLEHSLADELRTLSLQEKSVKTLSEVPCGDAFPTCKFIKDSHKNKNLIDGQRVRIETFQGEIKEIQSKISDIVRSGIEEQISNYEERRERLRKLEVDVSKKGAELMTAKSEGELLAHHVLESQRRLQDMETNLVDEEVSQELVTVKDQIAALKEEINQIDSDRMQQANRLGRIDNDLETLRNEKRKYQEIKAKWRLHEFFTQAVSKRGIPLQIMMTQLPLINAEIAKILQGIVTFNIELEADKDSNDMDVYINYGDSKRIIEVASGMEKMIASMAIRVALINVSSLPKTDMFIIDEGFDALDDLNVEACNRMLISLKKWFKTILIVTHIDGVKDVVDNVIDVTWNGKDAQIVLE